MKKMTLAHVAEREMTWFIQNVSNLVLNPWMVYDIGMVSLHDRVGTRVLQSTGGRRDSSEGLGQVDKAPERIFL